MDPKEFINSIAPAAQALQQESGVFASVTIDRPHLSRLGKIHAHREGKIFIFVEQRHISVYFARIRCRSLAINIT